MRRSTHIKADWLKPQLIDLPDSRFKPDYSPFRMLKLGVFGGNYFDAATAGDFRGLGGAVEKQARVNFGTFDPRRNCFGHKAGLTFADWDERGWIFNEDPLGWFHWYCRYHAGRKHMRDSHQIGRWVKYKDRWTDRARTQRDTTGRVSPVIMQGLLQWGIDPYLGDKS